MPSNDYFSTATPITGASGVVLGTNVGAGVEAGEPFKMTQNPASSGSQNSYPSAAATNTVWWTWTCPSTGDYYFTTRDAAGTPTDFPSVLQVFTGSAVNALTEVSYLENEGAGFGNGFEYGALVAFTATVGTVYFIRVDGRRSKTGNIWLSWNSFVAPRLGSCGGCPIDFQSEICVATISISDVTTDGFYPFGSFPQVAGIYKVLWCGGVIPPGSHPTVYQGAISVWNNRTVYNIGDQVLSTNYAWNTPYDGKVYTANGTTTLYDPLDRSDIWSFAGTGGFQFEISAYSPAHSWTSESYYSITAPGGSLPWSGDDYSFIGVPCPACQPGFDTTGSWSGSGIGLSGFICSSTPSFCATGGVIGIAFATQWQTVFTPVTNIPTRVSAYSNGNNPSFQLVFNPLLISMLTPAGCSLSGSGTSWSISFNAFNASPIAWSNVTFTLLVGGGISSPGSPVVVNLNGNSTTNSIGPISFTADPTAGLITATIQVSMCGIVVGNLTLPLYPIVSTYLATPFNETVCGTDKYARVNILNSVNQICMFALQTGQLIVTATDVLSGNSLNLISNTNCGTATTSLTIGENFGITSFSATISVIEQATARQVQITIQPQCEIIGHSWINLPLFQQTITVPANPAIIPPAVNKSTSAGSSTFSAGSATKGAGD